MDEQIENMEGESVEDEKFCLLEKDLCLYPLRDSSEDPVWAVKTMWTWVGIAVFLLGFIVVMLILGIWYD